MIGLKKNAYRFEIMNSDNINAEVINDAEELINYVIGVNNHLLAFGETGWLFIEKIKETKKGPTVLYVAKLELPIQEVNTSFDHLLAPFYTRKKLPYDKTLVSPLAEEYFEGKSDSEEIQTPELPESLAALANKGAQEFEQVEPVENVEEIVQETETEPLQEKQQDQSNVQQQQMNELIKQMKKQQEEIKELKQMKRGESLTTESISVPVQPNVASSFIVDDFSTIRSNETVSEELTPVEEEGKEKKESSIPDLPSHPSDQVVTDVLDMVKNEFSTRLFSFVSSEMDKINEEIKQLDTRGSIEKEITNRIENEKEQAIETESTRLSLEKQSLLQEEKQRHEAALTNIEASYMKNMEDKLKELTSSYESRRQTEISEEYQRQTKQLSMILQGKKEELSLRQKDLNAGLKDDFAQVLASFNANHEQVIQQIEKQKEQNVPIDFLAHLKRA